MPKKEKILIIVGILIALFGVFFLISRTAPKEISPPPDSNPIGLASGVTTMEINGVSYEDEISGQISVYDFMDKLQKEGKINFKDKTYTGMGKLIEEINGIKSAGGKYWIYYVNGIEAQVGVLDYKINPGDIVSWKYGSF